MKNKIFLITFGLLFIGLTSANGLVINTNDLSINKTHRIDLTFQVNITNTENFKFYNITIEEDLASVPKFNLESGETKIVTVNYTGDEDYNGVLKFRGEYEANLGASNQTEIINIDYEDGFDRCNLNLIIGDSITWVNNVNDYIKLINAETGNSFQTIQENKNITKTFESPETFSYYAQRITKFTEVCKIEIQNDEGLVHSFDFDAELNINVEVIYPETTMELTVLETNYSLNYNEEIEGSLLIKNIGSKDAINTYLDGDWIEFMEDGSWTSSLIIEKIESGKSKSISYRINPTVFETNQTNKTHIKTLSVIGNFITLTKDFNVFIEYSNLDSLFGDYGIDDDTKRAIIIGLCEGNEDWDVCSFLDANNNLKDDNLTQEISKNALVELLTRYTEQSKIDTEFKKNQTETDIIQTNSINNLAENQTITNEKLEKIISDNKQDREIQIFIIIFMMVVFGLGKAKKVLNRKRKEQPNLKKGEPSW